MLTIKPPTRPITKHPEKGFEAMKSLLALSTILAAGLATAGCSTKSKSNTRQNQVSVVIEAPKTTKGSKFSLAEGGTFLPFSIGLKITASDGTIVRKSVSDGDELSLDLPYGPASVETSFFAAGLAAGESKASFCAKKSENETNTSNSGPDGDGVSNAAEIASGFSPSAATRTLSIPAPSVNEFGNVYFDFSSIIPFNSHDDNLRMKCKLASEPTFRNCYSSFNTQVSAAGSYELEAYLVDREGLKISDLAKVAFAVASVKTYSPETIVGDGSKDIVNFPNGPTPTPTATPVPFALSVAQPSINRTFTTSRPALDIYFNAPVNMSSIVLQDSSGTVSGANVSLVRIENGTGTESFLDAKLAASLGGDGYAVFLIPDDTLEQSATYKIVVSPGIKKNGTNEPITSSTSIPFSHIPFGGSTHFVVAGTLTTGGGTFVSGNFNVNRSGFCSGTKWRVQWTYQGVILPNLGPVSISGADANELVNCADNSTPLNVAAIGGSIPSFNIFNPSLALLKADGFAVTAEGGPISGATSFLTLP